MHIRDIIIDTGEQSLTKQYNDREKSAQNKDSNYLQLEKWMQASASIIYCEWQTQTVICLLIARTKDCWGLILSVAHHSCLDLTVRLISSIFRVHPKIPELLKDFSGYNKQFLGAYGYAISYFVSTNDLTKPLTRYILEIETTSNNEQKQYWSSCVVYLSVHEHNSKTNKMQPTAGRENFRTFQRTSVGLLIP